MGSLLYKSPKSTVYSLESIEGLLAAAQANWPEGFMPFSTGAPAYVEFKFKKALPRLDLSDHLHLKKLWVSVFAPKSADLSDLVLRLGRERPGNWPSSAELSASTRVATLPEHKPTTGSVIKVRFIGDPERDISFGIDSGLVPSAKDSADWLAGAAEAVGLPWTIDWLDDETYYASGPIEAELFFYGGRIQDRDGVRLRTNPDFVGCTLAGKTYQDTPRPLARALGYCQPSRVFSVKWFVLAKDPKKTGLARRVYNDLVELDWPIARGNALLTAELDQLAGIEDLRTVAAQTGGVFQTTLCAFDAYDEWCEIQVVTTADGHSLELSTPLYDEIAEINKTLGVEFELEGYQ